MRAPTATIALVAALACGRGEDRVAAAIRRDLARELGEPIRTVRCQATACEAVTAAGLRIAIARTGRAPVTWTTVDLLDPRPIAAEVHAALASVGSDQAVDCGPLRLASADGDHLACALGGGGAAFVDVAADGAVAVELAMTAAIAEARRAAVDPAELERQSRALDTDEAEGAEPDGEADAAVDAGVDTGPPTTGG